MVNLSVKIGRLKLKNPVVAASGTFGMEYKDLVDINLLGAIVMKTITLNPRTGNPPPRIAETASGMLNSIGLENKGCNDFINNRLPLLKNVRTPIIASISGDDENEFEELARRLSKAGRIDALELNLSCPNLRKKVMISHDAGATGKVVKAVRKATGLTIIAKLSPNVTDIVTIAKSAESSGADALSLTNTFLGLAVDIETRKPKLGNLTGGLSGPAIKPLALRMVREVYKAVNIPIIGMGGIMDYRDALEFIICGARAIQIGTANFVNPKASTEILNGIRQYLADKKLNDINKLIGCI